MKKFIVTIIALVTILGLGYYTVNELYLSKKNKEIETDLRSSSKDKPSSSKEVKKPEFTTLKFVATGDALIHGAVYKDAKTDDGYDFRPQLKYVKPIIQSYDLAFYNQETVFAGEDYGFSGYPRFNSPKEVGDAMIDAGFNVVALANNHSIDKGEKGTLNSIAYWEDTEVMWHGYNKIENADDIMIMTKNDITYAMLSYTSVNNIKPLNKTIRVNEYSYAQAKKDVESIKDKVDVIIVSIHWGVEYSHTPSSFQIQAAKELASLGVHIICGHHPHVLQPITRINDTLVIYSLGNFISAQRTTAQLTGALVGLEIKKDYKTNKITVSDPEVDLIYTIKNNRYRDFKLMPFTDINDSILPNSKKIYDDAYKVITKMDENIKVKELGSNLVSFNNDNSKNVAAVVVPHHDIVKNVKNEYWEILKKN
ncbi:MAG: CapA family protein [Mollicutes bacterium]|nr:CapA family protein [Mollicutes bacterium]